MYQGSKVRLTAIEREDLKQFKEWRNDLFFRKHFREYRELNMDMQMQWYDNKVLSDPNTMMFAIRSVDGVQLLGCCGLCYINWVHRNADLSLYIGWNNAYIDPEGFAKESCQLLFKYGFNELGLEKIWTEIYEFDHLKYKLYHQLGFHDDGQMRKQYFYDGYWWDSYILSLLRDEWLVLEG